MRTPLSATRLLIDPLHRCSSHEPVRRGQTRPDEEVRCMRHHHRHRMLPVRPHLSLVRIHYQSHSSVNVDDLATHRDRSCVQYGRREALRTVWGEVLRVEGLRPKGGWTSIVI